MFAGILMLALAPFAAGDLKVLELQAGLDRAGYSCNTIDGVWGPKSSAALRAYCRDRKLRQPATPEEALAKYFPAADTGTFVRVRVRAEDIAALVDMPAAPEEKAALEHMGYASIRDMFAERGHMSKTAFDRLNAGLAGAPLKAGAEVVIPYFPSIAEELDAWPKRDRPKGAPVRPNAAEVRISLSRCEISAYDDEGKRLAFFPCSIAKSKSKLPAHGELEIVNRIPNPNYTYTPDAAVQGAKASRHIFPPGPRNPVGVAWLGLNLPGYGIHGTPSPESVGKPESHGCFRLSNWNAARLYAICPIGTKVIIEP